jgi:predicted RNA-binding protein YlxR (DUF448 family)
VSSGSGQVAFRTCVGCRVTAPKSDLLRVVRGPVGLAVDAPKNGRVAAGRGAYVHPVPACVRAAAGVRVLARALRSDVSVDEVGRLEEALVRALEVR